MTILCIETSTSVCSAAICKDGKPVEQCISQNDGNHARLLPRYIESLLHYAAQSGLTIDAVALSEGPGSYTGLSIGTSTAKGVCYGLNIPLIPVPTLQILCAAAKEQLTSVECTQQLSLCPMIDARRMEVYTALYDAYLHPCSEVKAVVVENEDSLCASGEVVYFGDGAAKCQSVLLSNRWHYIPDIVPQAGYMGQLAETKISSGYKGSDIAYYEPFYLKDFVAAQSHVKGLN